MPQNSWLLPDEKRTIISFYDQNLSEGYRRLAYMMFKQADIASKSWKPQKGNDKLEFVAKGCTFKKTENFNTTQPDLISQNTTCDNIPAGVRTGKKASRLGSIRSAALNGLVSSHDVVHF